jgi:hypothetical protein
MNAFLLVTSLLSANAFHTTTLLVRPRERKSNSSLHTAVSRRDTLFGIPAAIGLLTPGWVSAEAGSSSSVYKPAVRPTAYRVDSTIPPTLLSLTAGQERKVLLELGQGSGTDKEAVFVDRVNLNNMLNKAVFGTIDTITSLSSETKESRRKGPGSASFVCLGVPKDTTSQDVDLAIGLMSIITQSRKGATALGLSFLPYSAQPVLDAYVKGAVNQDDLFASLTRAGVVNNLFMHPYFSLQRVAASIYWRCHPNRRTFSRYANKACKTSTPSADLPTSLTPTDLSPSHKSLDTSCIRTGPCLRTINLSKMESTNPRRGTFTRSAFWFTRPPPRRWPSTRPHAPNHSSLP